MTNRGIVDTADPIQVDQPSGFDFRLKDIQRGDTFLQTAASSAKVVPIPVVNRCIRGIVPSGVFQSRHVAMNSESLARHLAVVRHRQCCW